MNYEAWVYCMIFAAGGFAFGVIVGMFLVAKEIVLTKKGKEDAIRKERDLKARDPGGLVRRNALGLRRPMEESRTFDDAVGVIGNAVDPLSLRRVRGRRGVKTEEPEAPEDGRGSSVRYRSKPAE
jgi:hypothetical protein